MTLRLPIFVGMAVCDAFNGGWCWKTFPCVFRLKFSAVIGCFRNYVVTFGAMSRVALDVYRSVSQYFFVSSCWSLIWSRNFPYIIGHEHAFVLICPCLEPDQSTPRTHPLLPHTSAYLKLLFPRSFSRNFM